MHCVWFLFGNGTLHLCFLGLLSAVFVSVFQVMGRVGFNFPIFLTLIHYSIAWFLLAFFKALSLLPVSPPSKTTPFSSLFSLGVVMAFASGLANTSLKHNRFPARILFPFVFLPPSFLAASGSGGGEGWYLSCFLTLDSSMCSVGFYQMAKIAVTPTIVFSEFILFKKTISFKKVSNQETSLYYCTAFFV